MGWQIVPFMKEVCKGKELSNDMLYGDDGDVHDRVDELQGSIGAATPAPRACAPPTPPSN